MLDSLFPLLALEHEVSILLEHYLTYLIFDACPFVGPRQQLLRSEVVEPQLFSLEVLTVQLFIGFWHRLASVHKLVEVAISSLTDLVLTSGHTSDAFHDDITRQRQEYLGCNLGY